MLQPRGHPEDPVTRSAHGTGVRVEEHTSGSSGSMPRPHRHPDDTRFDKRVRKRIVYCDGDRCEQWFRFQPFGFDGAYVHRCAEAEGAQTETLALQLKEAAYMAGSWDATWLCVSCWGDRLSRSTGRHLTPTETRSLLGIEEAQNRERARKSLRTRDGAH